MVEINRPPSDITPQDFFENWLKAEYDRLRSDSALPGEPPDGTVAVAVEGDTGGSWTLTMAAGQFSVTAGAASGADVAISISVDDWREVVAGDELTPKEGPGIEAMFIGSSATTDVIKSLKGTMIFQVTEFKGRTWSAKMTLGGAAEPEATISVDTDTLRQIRDKELPPPQAFFSGKIAITGDAAFAMQAGMAMMTPA